MKEILLIPGVSNCVLYFEGLLAGELELHFPMNSDTLLHIPGKVANMPLTANMSMCSEKKYKTVLAADSLSNKKLFK